MSTNKTNLRDIKKLRLERHWSQEQLAEMSGLSVRTIQRIENGENAGLESLKSLAAVFETNIEDSDKNAELEQLKKEEAYIEKLKGFYKLLGFAGLNLVLFFFLAVSDSDSEGWWLFFYMLIVWIAFLGMYSYINFDFFGEEWKNQMLKKKFPHKK